MQGEEPGVPQQAWWFLAISVALVLGKALGAFAWLGKAARWLWHMGKRAMGWLREMAAMPAKMRKVEARLELLREAPPPSRKTVEIQGIRWARNEATEEIVAYCDVCYQEKGSLFALDVFRNPNSPDSGEMWANCRAKQHHVSMMANVLTLARTSADKAIPR